MSSLPTPLKRHVLLASQGARLAPFARRTTQTLLGVLDGELTGLFVEDAQLLTAARLPFTREVGRYSGVVRALECQDLEREFRRHAKIFRDELAGLAGEVRRPWHFEQRRGEVLATVLESLGANDVAVVALGDRTASQPRTESAAATRVAVLTPHESSTSLRTARALTHALGATLKVTFAQPATQAPDDPPGADRAHGIPPNAISAGIASISQGCSVMLVSAALMPLDPSQRRALLGQFRGLLILVTD